MVGRDPEPLYARDRRVGRQGRDRDRDAARGLPFRGDQGRTVARERAARADQGRRPPRDGSRRRLCGEPRTDDRGHPHHERDEYQRRTHEPLSQRPAVVRAVRPLRHLCRGRGQRRVARHGLRRQHAGQGAGLCAGTHGTQPAHGAARQEPSFGHHLVDGQRGGHGPQLRGMLPLDQGVRPFASGALRTCRVRSGRGLH